MKSIKPRWEMTDKEREAQANKTFMIAFFVIVPVSFVGLSAFTIISLLLQAQIVVEFGILGSQIVAFIVFILLMMLGIYLGEKILKLFGLN